MPRYHSNRVDLLDFPRFILFFLLLALLAGVAWQYRDINDAQIGLTLRRALYEITHVARNLW